jgi:hypothetical protein
MRHPTDASQMLADFIEATGLPKPSMVVSAGGGCTSMGRVARTHAGEPQRRCGARSMLAILGAGTTNHKTSLQHVLGIHLNTCSNLDFLRQPVTCPGNVPPTSPDQGEHHMKIYLAARYGRFPENKQSPDHKPAARLTASGKW